MSVLPKKSAFLIVPFVLFGCGGGGTRSQPGAAGIDLGPVTTRAVGTVGSPLVTGGKGTVVTGLAGASFLEATVNLPPISAQNDQQVLDQTQIAFSSFGKPYLFDYGTYKTHSLANETSYNTTVSCTPGFAGTGTSVATSELVSPTSRQILLTNTDGSGRRTLTAGSNYAWNPSVNKTGSFVVFDRLVSANNRFRIFRVPAAGGTAVQLGGQELGFHETRPVYSPDSTRILFRRLDVNNGGESAWVMKADGTSPQIVSIPSGGYIIDLKWHPNNQDVLVLTYTPAIGYRIHRASLATGGYQELLTTMDIVGSIAVAPTGTQYAYTLIPSGGNGVFLKVAPFGGIGTPQTLLYSADIYGIQHLDWGPYLQARKVVGTGSPLLPSAAGFLFAQNGPFVSSFVAFDSPTRSGVTITSQNDQNPNQPNVIVLVEASDSLSALSYLNGMGGFAVKPIVPAKPAKGAVVSFDADTGSVVAILPYSRSVADQSVVRETKGREVVFKADFLGVYDRHGNNLKPDGAMEAVLDPATGALIRYR